MKDASQYPVTFGFGATTAPYTKQSPHLGEDRKMPAETPIVVNGQIIGLSGNSGKSTGAHLHIQRVANGKVIPPLGGGFSLPKSVVVTETGFTNEVGNYIRLKDANGEVWSYFHLFEIKVKVGDKIGDDMKMSSGTVENLYLSGWQRKATAEEHKRWDGKEMEEFFYAGGKNQYQWLWDEIKRRDVRIKALEETSSPALIKLAEAIRELK